MDHAAGVDRCILWGLGQQIGYAQVAFIRTIYIVLIRLVDADEHQCGRVDRRRSGRVDGYGQRFGEIALLPAKALDCREDMRPVGQQFVAVGRDGYTAADRLAMADSYSVNIRDNKADVRNTGHDKLPCRLRRAVVEVRKIVVIGDAGVAGRQQVGLGGRRQRVAPEVQTVDLAAKV